jgi:AcrR family transcriptional regulator
VVDAETRRPVGRPSVREQRRDEILDAAVQVILDHGIAGATRARIAERAGVRPPAIHHFVGTQAEVLRAAIERIGHRLTADVIPDDGAPADPAARALATIDAAFGAVIDEPTVNRFVDELVAHSYRDDGTRDALAEVYRVATDQLAIELQHAWGPAFSVETRAAAAEIVALAHAAGTFRHLGLSEQAEAAHRRARQLVVGGPAASS